MTRPVSSVVIGHPTANQFFRHTVSALYEAGALAEAATCVDGARILARWGRILPAAVRREISRRAFDEPWRTRLRTRPSRELARLVAQRLGWERRPGNSAAWGSLEWVYQDFDRWMSGRLSNQTAVYAYEDGALAMFSRAAELGVARIYDLPIAYWETVRRLLAEEGERRPEWAVTLGGGLTDSPAKLARKTRELELADLVVVPSKFVADSLPDWARVKPVVVSPFGSPVASEEGMLEREARRRAGQPLRVLFAGSMGQRKGLGDLMAAVRLLKRTDLELIVMGSMLAPPEFYRQQCPGYVHEPGRSHAEVLTLMRTCDVFCLPSIVEGRALVMQEAMSQGLPVILTANTGGEDLIALNGSVASDGVEAAPWRGRTGFLVPIRSPEKIAAAVAWFADHRGETMEMGREARDKSQEYTWKDYGGRIVRAIAALRNPNGLG